jgi:hypothetical protein
MMRTTLAGTLGLLLALSSTAALAWGTAGNGTIRTESRKIAAFSEIDASGGVALVIRKGEPSLIIAGDENLLKLIRTEVKGQTLVIAQTESNLRPTRQIEITLTTPNLKAVDASGGVHITLESGADPSLKLDFSGGVEFNASALEVTMLDVHSSGGVQLKLAGKAKEVRYDLSGGVGVDARNLDTAKVSIDASGGCELKVRATESISGEASGGVSVRVAGNPPRSRMRTSGGADVEYER